LLRKIALAAAIAAALVAGSAFAASRWIITNLHQIKPSVAAQLRGKQGPPGTTGATGATGATGPQGAQGPAGISTVHDVSSAPVSYCASSGGACSVASATAYCPPGSYAVGGAAYVTSIDTPISTFAASTSYAAVSNDDGPFAGSLTATAVCASGPGLQYSLRGNAEPDAAARLAAELRAEKK
jgi:hypothetical protein